MAFQTKEMSACMSDFNGEWQKQNKKKCMFNFLSDKLVNSSMCFVCLMQTQNQWKQWLLVSKIQHCMKMMQAWEADTKAWTVEYMLNVDSCMDNSR